MGSSRVYTSGRTPSRRLRQSPRCVAISPPPHLLIFPDLTSAPQTRYQLSLCSPLPDPSSSTPENDCPSGTRLCLKTYSSRSGLDDRLLSVVPVAGEIGAGELAPKASEVGGEVKPVDAWILEVGGGKYGSVEQKARIEMRCDAKATEVRPALFPPRTSADAFARRPLLSRRITTRRPAFSS